MSGGFASMGGYALYVWGAFVLTLLAMGVEVLCLVRRRAGAARRPSGAEVEA